MKLRSLFLLLLGYWSLTVSTGQEPDTLHENQETSHSEITPPDVYARVALLRAELELIRFEMGKTKPAQSQLPVSDAAPREVYFQAFTLLLKSDRLCFEQTREHLILPETHAGSVTPAHSFRLVTDALKMIRKVKVSLAITTHSQEPVRNIENTATSVFQSIVRANQQLNLLLDKPFAPSDVFQQVTRAINHSATLLKHVSSSIRIPPDPAFENGKKPADVYRQLAGCFEHLEAIAEISGVEVLKLDSTGIDFGKVSPSDVYDIASLVVSELAHFVSKLPKPPPPRATYFPGRKFPSHVYQRAGILEAQLKQLEQFARKNPNWLKPNESTQTPNVR